jgi:hypothetical protein
LNNETFHGRYQTADGTHIRLERRLSAYEYELLYETSKLILKETTACRKLKHYIRYINSWVCHWFSIGGSEFAYNRMPCKSADFFLIYLTTIKENISWKANQYFFLIEVWSLRAKNEVEINP